MKSNDVREPAVCGQFYPSGTKELVSLIASFVDKKASNSKSNVIGCMLPHAGYVYSGKVAALTISNIKIAESLILIGPNHTGYGTEFSMMSQGWWKTPLGNIKINVDLAQKIQEKCAYIQEDSLAHQFEHSLEVELPLLQYFKSDFQIVPIAIMSGDLKKLKIAGVNIAQAIIESKQKDSIMLVASSDMTHYESETQAKKKDETAINAILELNEDKLFERINSYNITMCGFAPVIVMLAAAKLLGAKTAKLIKYQTSGDTTGDKTSVVGYAGIVIT